MADKKEVSVIEGTVPAPSKDIKQDGSRFTQNSQAGGPQQTAPQKPADSKNSATPQTPSGETEPDKKSQFVSDKFTKNLEEIGNILRASVTAQNKSFKSDLDKVEKTYSGFIEATRTQKSTLEKASKEQQEVFKNLTEQFVSFREDENADAERFHKDLMASLQALHAAGGDEEATQSIEKLIREGMKTSQVDPDRAKYDKKWALSDKEKDHWSYKLFGEKERQSDISPEEKAIAAGKSEFLSKGLFGAGKDTEAKEGKTPTEKMIESILKITQENKAAKDSSSGPIPDKIEKLTISNLIIEKMSGVLSKDQEKIGMRERVPQISVEKGPSYEELRKNSTDVQDVEFREHEKEVAPKPEPVILPHEREITPVKEEVESKPAIKITQPTPKPEFKQVRNLNTDETAMSKAIRSALGEFKPPIEKPVTMAQVATGHKEASVIQPAHRESHHAVEMKHNDVKTAAQIAEPAIAAVPHSDAITPKSEVIPHDLAKAPEEAAAPEAKESEGSGLGIGDVISGAKTVSKLLPSLGGAATAAGGAEAAAAGGAAATGGGLASLALPAAGVVAAGAVGYGVGTLASKGYEKARGGKGSIGTDLFNLFGDSGPSANETSAKAFAEAQAKKRAASPIINPPTPVQNVAVKPTESPNVMTQTSDTNEAKNAADEAKKSQPIIIQQNSGGSAAPAPAPQQALVTGRVRGDRDNAFEKAMSRSFTGI